MYFCNNKGTLYSKLIACFMSPHGSCGYVVVQFFLGLSFLGIILYDNEVKTKESKLYETTTATASALFLSRTVLFFEL